MVNFDDLLNEVNAFGKYQKLRYLLICFAGLLPPLITYLHPFVVPNPDHRCTLPEFVDDKFSTNQSIYRNITFQKCTYDINGTKTKCNSWVFDKTYYKTTLTEEWLLVCDKSVWRANAQTIYFSGLLIGSIVLGFLSDRFGRRPIVLFSFLLILIGAIGVAFGPQKSLGTLFSYIIYCTSRFIIAIGTRGINLTAYVLGIELLDSKKKTFAGMVFLLGFPVGQLILALLSFLVRDWHTLSWILVIPCVPTIAYFFFLPESPRWLISKNQNEKAFEILKTVAKTNKKKLDEHLWKDFLASENKKEKIKEENFFSVLRSLPLFVITIICIIHWIVNNLIFYGVGLKSNDLGMNPYLTFSLSAFVELIGTAMSALVVDYLGRKKSYGSFLFIAGASCFSIVFIHNQIAVVAMALIGKFFVSASYSILYLYTTEIFPTSIRNSLMGVCNGAARIGSMVAPYAVILGDIGWKPLPFLIFGVCGILTGFTTVLLPETHGRSLLNTIEEAEQGSLKCLKKCSKNQNNEN